LELVLITLFAVLAVFALVTAAGAAVQVPKEGWIVK
jgi:hypothetical protein